MTCVALRCCDSEKKRYVGLCGHRARRLTAKAARRKVLEPKWLRTSICPTKNMAVCTTTTPLCRGDRPSAARVVARLVGVERAVVRADESALGQLADDLRVLPGMPAPTHKPPRDTIKAASVDLPQTRQAELSATTPLNRAGLSFFGVLFDV